MATKVSSGFLGTNFVQTLRHGNQGQFGFSGYKLCDMATKVSLGFLGTNFSPALQKAALVGFRK
jgi:hypothetical protein